MCQERVRRKDTYHASDFFFAAIVSLVMRGVLDGAGLARHYKKSSRMIDAWHEHALRLAAQVGLYGEGAPDKSSLQQLCAQLQPSKESLMSARGIDVPPMVPSVIENPTGVQLANMHRGSRNLLVTCMHVSIMIARMHADCHELLISVQTTAALLPGPVAAPSHPLPGLIGPLTSTSNLLGSKPRETSLHGGLLPFGPPHHILHVWQPTSEGNDTMDLKL